MTGSWGVLLLTAVLCFLALLNWRRGVKLLLVMVIIEGALRKWVFPSAQQLLYFAKDGILVCAFLGYLKDGAHIMIPRAMRVLVIAVAVIAFLNIFNPALPSVLLGIVGWKSYVLYTLL